MPLNRAAPGTRASDRVLRFLDCAVVDYSVRMIAETEGTNIKPWEEFSSRASPRSQARRSHWNPTSS